MKKFILLLLIAALCLPVFGCTSESADSLDFVKSEFLARLSDRAESAMEVEILPRGEDGVRDNWVSAVYSEYRTGILAAKSESEIRELYLEFDEQLININGSFSAVKKGDNLVNLTATGVVGEVEFSVERVYYCGLPSASFMFRLNANSEAVGFKGLAYGCEFVVADENKSEVSLKSGTLGVLKGGNENGLVAFIVTLNSSPVGYVVMDHFSAADITPLYKAVTFTEPMQEDEAIARIESVVGGDFSLRQDEKLCVVFSTTESKSDSVAKSDLVTVTGLGRFEELSVLLDKSENSLISYEVRVKAEGEDEETLAFNGGDTVSWTKNKSGYMAIIGYENDCPTFVSVISVQYSGEIAYAEQFTYCFSATDRVPIGRINAIISYYGGI